MYCPGYHWIYRVTGANISQIEWIVKKLWPYRRKIKEQENNRHP
jgi:hypothetical protein